MLYLLSHATRSDNTQLNIAHETWLRKNMKYYVWINLFVFSFDYLWFLLLVCRIFKQEVVAIFGPELTPSTVNHIRSTSNALSVPHIETGFDYLWERPEFSVNVSPHPWAIGSVRHFFSFLPIHLCSGGFNGTHFTNSISKTQKKIF